VFNPGIIDDGDFLPAPRPSGAPPVDPWFGPQPASSRDHVFLEVTRANSGAVRRVLESDRRSTKPSVFFGEAFWRIPNELCEQVKREVLSEQQTPGEGRYSERG
jgi:hypothetical protein